MFNIGIRASGGGATREVGTSSTAACGRLRVRRVRTGVREYSQIRCGTRLRKEGVWSYAGFVTLDSMYAAPTTSISELPGIHDSAKHERGGAPYFVSAQNPL